MRSRKWALILATSFVLPMPAVAACSLTHADLPVKIVGLRALIPVTFNGSDATMVVDSGDFYSMLSSASAMALKLKVVASPNISFVRGIRGTASVALTSVDRFVLENIPFNRKVQFLVGGTDAGNDAAGLLGQNILGVDDTEYDLANGMIRLMTPKNCHRQVLAYWAARDKLPVSMVDLENTRGYPSGILSSAFLNGHRILVMFDSGAPLSVLTLHAARRAGITPNSPGVTPAGMAFGVGQSLTRSWIGTFESLKIGQEEIKHTRLRFADISPGDVDMILGMDFFLSHRIYVARSQGRLYFTYNGGPVFNLQPPAAPAKPIAATPLAQRGYSTGISPAKDAAGLAAQGDALLARHEYAQAIASLTQAIRIDAGHPDYFYQRAVAYRATRQAAPALQDLDQALKLEPSYVDALLARAAIELSEKDRDAARADIDAVSHFESDESDRRLALSSFYEALDARQKAIQQLDLWIAVHAKDAKLASALNTRCWDRMLLDEELRSAEDDCNAALRYSPDNPAYLDSLGWVHLRLGEFSESIRDFNAALKRIPKQDSSLYGRGIAELRLNKRAAGEADIAAATAAPAAAIDELRRYHLAP